MIDSLKQPILQPLTMGQLLDRAFRLYRKNFISFLGIVAIAQLPVMLVTILATMANPELSGSAGPIQDVDVALAAGLLAFVVAIVGGIMTQIGTAVITRAVADDYMGRSVGVIEAYRKIGRSWISLLGTLILAGFLYMGLLIVFIIPCIGWALAIPGVGGVTYFGLVVLPLVAPVIILERFGGIKAIARAWNLARRRFWWALGLMLLVNILAQVIITGPALLIGALLGSFGLDAGVGAVVAQNVVQSLLAILYSPLQLTCVTLLYFDIRVRVEGFDLALSTLGDDMDIADLSDSIPDSEKRLVVDTTEAGYFTAITVGALAIGFGFVAIIGGLTALLTTLS